MRRVLALVAWMLVVVGAVAGCGSLRPADGTASPSRSDEFWRAVGSTSLLHLVSDPPRDLRELAERSDLVVRGHVESIEPGMEYPSMTGPATRTVNAKIVVSTVIKGHVPDQLLLQVLPTIGYDFDAFARTVPTSESVFFLTALAGDPSATNVACTVSPLCLFSEDSTGLVIAPRDEFLGREWFGASRPGSLEELESAARAR